MTPTNSRFDNTNRVIQKLIISKNNDSSQNLEDLIPHQYLLKLVFTSWDEKLAHDCQKDAIYLLAGLSFQHILM